MTMQLIVTSPVRKFLWRDLKWHFCMCLKTMLQRLFLHHSANTKLVIQVWNCTKSTRKNRDFLGQIYKIWSWELAISKMLSVKNVRNRGLFYWTSLLLAFKIYFHVLSLLSIWSETYHLWSKQQIGRLSPLIIDIKCFIFLPFSLSSSAHIGNEPGDAWIDSFQSFLFAYPLYI